MSDSHTLTARGSSVSRCGIGLPTWSAPDLFNSPGPAYAGEPVEVMKRSHMSELLLHADRIVVSGLNDPMGVLAARLAQPRGPGASCSPS